MFKTAKPRRGPMMTATVASLLASLVAAPLWAEEPMPVTGSDWEIHLGFGGQVALSEGQADAPFTRDVPTDFQAGFGWGIEGLVMVRILRVVSLGVRTGLSFADHGLVESEGVFVGAVVRYEGLDLAALELDVGNTITEWRGGYEGRLVGDPEYTNDFNMFSIGLGAHFHLRPIDWFAVELGPTFEVRVADTTFYGANEADDVEGTWTQVLVGLSLRNFAIIEIR